MAGALVILLSGRRVFHFYCAGRFRWNIEKTSGAEQRAESVIAVKSRGEAQRIADSMNLSALIREAVMKMLEEDENPFL